MKGADPHAAGDASLLQAAQSGDVEIMRLLIERVSRASARTGAGTRYAGGSALE